MNRVFAADLHVRIAADAAPQTVEWTVILASLPPNADWSFWDNMFDHFAKVVNFGGLCGAELRAAQSLLDAQPAQSPDARTRMRRFGIQGVDAGCWRVLLNMHLAASVYCAPVASLQLQTISGARRAALNASTALAQPYPTYPASLPFRVERFDDGAATVDRLVRIGFAAEPSEEALRSITGALLSWDELLMGGYPEDDQPPESNATDATEVYLSDPLTLDHPLPNFIGSESAFDVVVNMATRVATQVAVIDYIEIH